VTTASCRSDMALIPKIVLPEPNTYEEYNKTGLRSYGKSLLNSAVRTSLSTSVCLSTT
jgi:hypothetical protein